MIYHLTQLAKADIEAIYHYTVEHFGEDQAVEYLDGLEFSFELLMDNPSMGRLFDGSIRRYIYKGHLVYYEIKEEKLVIVRIRSARQKT